MVVWHGLTSEDRRNVSGSTGRIPQSCATRSLHWGESATYFSMRTALLYLFLILPLSLSPCFPVWLQVCPSFSPSTLFLISPFVLPAHSLSVSVSLVSLLVNLSVRLLVTLSILLSYFAFILFFICPHALFACVFRLQIFMPLGIYTPNVIILSFCSGLSVLQLFTFLSLFASSLSLPLSFFLWHIVLQVLSRGHSGECRGMRQKRRTHIHSRDVCEYDTGMLVINAVP